jgi:V8-like Glu-specific endopeptidase
MATASFISSTGLMLTNNHVLGTGVCPKEGCYVELSFDWQAGGNQQPATYYVVPQAVDVGLDMAVVQVYYSQGGAMLPTPDYLTMTSMQPQALLGKHVTIVGHPEGYLKKWTDGYVTDVAGDWVISSAYILPGDSGSPILNDAGQIVGLTHRGPTAQDLYTGNGVSTYSVGTASAPLIAAQHAPLPAVMISKTAATTAADFVDNNLVYLNSRTSTVSVNGVPTSALTLLGQACDAAEARTDFTSPDDLDSALQPCYDAQSWIECRSDASQQPYGKVCPPAAEIANWQSRFLKANQLQVAMNGDMDLYSVSTAVAKLQASRAQGTAAGAQTLQQALSQVNPVLDFTLADYLIQYQIQTYAGRNLSQLLLNYSSDSTYQLQGAYVADANAWLYSSGQLSKNDLLTALRQQYSDPNSTVGTKLYIEELQHDFGAL